MAPKIQTESFDRLALSNPSLSYIHSSLAPQKIPRADTPLKRATEAIWHAGTSLVAIQTIYHRDKQEVPMFIEDWPNIWKWLEFLHSKCVLENAYGKVIMLSIVSAIASALDALSEHEQLGRRMRKTPGVLAMLMHYWSLEGVNHRLPPGAGELFSYTLKKLLEDAKSEPSLLEDIVRVTEGGVDTIARVSLDHLKKAVNRRPPDFVNTISHLVILDKFAWYTCSPLRTAIHSRNPLATVMKSIDLLDSNAPASHLCVLVETWSYIASNILVTAAGPTEVKNILDAGFFHSLFKSAPKLTHMSAEAGDQFINDVFKFIGRHLIFRSVLVSSSKSINNVDLLSGDAAVARGPLWNAWLAFKNVVEERLVRKRFFDEDEKQCSGIGYGCRRPVCPVKSNNTNLMICASCKTSQYCSRECQRLDWPEHRNGCKSMQQDIAAGACISLSTSDRRFLDYVARDDYQFIIHPTLRTTMCSMYPNIPLSNMFALVDYTTFPPNYSVVPASSLKWDTPAAMESRDSLCRAAREAEGEKIVMRVEYMLGTFIRYSLMLVSLPESIL